MRILILLAAVCFDVFGQSAEQYLETLGARLVAGAPFTYRLQLTSAEWMNSNEPPILPGGIVPVPRSLVRDMQNEAELAGIIAHALAHVALRHDLKVPVASRRVLEIEADREAVRQMAAAGYEPAALATYFVREAKRRKGTIGRLFAIHPPPEERAEAIRAASTGLAVPVLPPSGDLAAVQASLAKDTDRPSLKRRQ